jgi:hypothetical protein
MRAARFVAANVPKPTNDTEPPFLSVVFTATIIDSKARVAAAFEISDCVAMCSMSSDLFTVNFLFEIRDKFVSMQILVVF